MVYNDLTCWQGVQNLISFIFVVKSFDPMSSYEGYLMKIIFSIYRVSLVIFGVIIKGGIEKK